MRDTIVYWTEWGVTVKCIVRGYGGIWGRGRIE